MSVLDNFKRRLRAARGLAAGAETADDEMQLVQMGNSYPIQVGTVQQDAVDEAHLAAIAAKKAADETRAFVLEHQEKLRGRVMPVEIYSVQNLPTHSCLIVNDYLLLSYVEAEQLIKQVFTLVQEQTT